MIQSSFFEAGNGGVLDCAILYRSTTVLLHPPAPLGKSPEIVVVMWLEIAAAALCRQQHNRRVPVCNAAKLNEALYIRPNHPGAAGELGPPHRARLPRWNETEGREEVDIRN